MSLDLDASNFNAFLFDTEKFMEMDWDCGVNSSLITPNSIGLLDVNLNPNFLDGDCLSFMDFGKNYF